MRALDSRTVTDFTDASRTQREFSRSFRPFGRRYRALGAGIYFLCTGTGLLGKHVPAHDSHAAGIRQGGGCRRRLLLTPAQSNIALGSSLVPG